LEERLECPLSTAAEHEEDTGRLKGFLDLLPRDGGQLLSFFMRPGSTMRYLVALRRTARVVVSDTDEKPLTEIISTAKWGYLRCGARLTTKTIWLNG